MARRGQAAMEFLMTYGWAILAVLVMIGALAYFGIFNTGRFTPDRCLFQTGLQCDDYKVTGTGATTVTLDFKVENKFGETITVSKVAVAGLAACQTLVPAASTAIPADGTLTVTCTGVTVPTGVAGQSAKLNTTITYRVLGGSYDRTATGEISTKVQ